MSTLVQAVEAVEEAKKRLPDKHTQTFFGKYDLYSYRPIFDDVLCPDCRQNALQIFYTGDEIRKKFPYLTYKDTDTFEVKQHPNCRCELKRITDPELYLLAITFLEL